MVGIDNTDVARRIASGREHLSSLREPYLRQLATALGLHYHRLETPEALARRLSTRGFEK